MTDEKRDLLLPKFVPAWLLAKAWEEARKPSLMMQLARDQYGDEAASFPTNESETPE